MGAVYEVVHENSQGLALGVSCDPPVGTKGYRFEQVPSGKPHWPISGSHVHFYEVNQSPVYKGCGCFWHNLNETVASDSPPKGMVNIKNNQVRGGGIRYD